MGLVEISERFGTSIDMKKPNLSFGLSNENAKAKLAEYGENKMKKKVQIPWYYQLLECFTNLFNLLLVFAAIIYFIFYSINPFDNFQNVHYLIIKELGIHWRNNVGYCGREHIH